MPDIQQAKDLLNQCDKKLRTYRNEAVEISKNKDVIAWQKVNIDSFLDIIAGLGLPSDLRQSRDTYPDIARAVLHEITSLQNSIANLEADINLGPLPADKAILEAKKIEKQISEILPSVTELRKCKTGLVSSSIALKKNLNLTTLLPLAREQATGQKKSVFETGFSIFLLTSKDPGFAEENQVNMYSFFDKATYMQKKLTEIDVNGLSQISASMVNHQIGICHDGLQEVKDFIIFIENYVKKDTDNINIFNTQLAEVTHQPLTDILFNIPTETEKVGACIRDFTHKKFLLEEIDRAAQLLIMIEQFCELLNHHFLNYLVEQESVENGLLNPATLATTRATSYFGGFYGFIRIVRLFLGSFTQKNVISLEILQEKLQAILENCALFFVNAKEGNEKITEFIESYFEQYSAPFPHNELVDVARKSLITYGTILEKVMYRFSVEKENTNTYSLGRLSNKIEVRMTNLGKYREKLTPSQ